MASFWFRIKRWLVGFQPAFLSLDAYEQFKLRVFVPNPPSYHYSWTWARPPNVRPAYNLGYIRRLLDHDIKLKKLLSGKHDYVVEAIVRGDDVMVGVFPAFWNRDGYSTDHVQVNNDLIFSFHRKAESKGCYRFIYTNRDGECGMLGAPAIRRASKHLSPYFPHRLPILVFRLDTEWECSSSPLGEQHASTR